MKERPILFSAPMVRAIVEGRKTQTRRVMKRKFPNGEPEGTVTSLGGWPVHFPDGTWEYEWCPYGQPGDRLWVKETYFAFGFWIKNGQTKAGSQKWKFIQTDSEVLYTDNPPAKFRASRDKQNPYIPAWYKRNSLFMPRAASRILLEIEVIRAERLQEISEADAIAEGVKEGCFTSHYVDYADQDYQFDNAKDSFRSLWQSINGPTSWEQNPVVWAITFKTLQP